MPKESAANAILYYKIILNTYLPAYLFNEAVGPLVGIAANMLLQPFFSAVQSSIYPFLPIFIAKLQDKVLTLREYTPHSTYAMAHNRKNIFSLCNALTLSVVSYMLYSILWFMLDDTSEAMSAIDLAIDFMMCLIFTFTSLACSYMTFRMIPFKDTFTWIIIYACCQFAANNLIAYGMVNVIEMLWPDAHNEVFWMKGIYSYAMIATFVSSIYANVCYLRSYIKARDEKQVLEVALLKEKEIALRSQLNSLKLQINPHFMFNNFNNLMELIEEDTQQAELFLNNLAKVYRYIIVNLDRNLIPIEDEMKFLDSYLYLMKVRYGSGVVMQVGHEVRDCKGFLPPAVLQLLVENAIKHNSFSAEHPLHIYITLTDGYIMVSNTRSPLLSEMKSTGLGHKNIIERYSLLCDKKVKIDDTEHRYSVGLPIINNIAIHEDSDS